MAIASLADFAAAVDSQISAPATRTNLATFTGWSAMEKTGLHPAPSSFDWSQWNNPMNTTRDWPGAVPVNSAGVKAYRSLDDGAAATAATLLEAVPGVLPNGYDAIVNRMQHSLPARFWGDPERAQLVTWGTGSAWLPDVPLQGDSPMEQQIQTLWDALEGGPAYFAKLVAGVHGAWYNFVVGNWQKMMARFDSIDKAIAGIATPPPPTVDFTLVLNSIADLKKHVQAIEDHLNAPRPPA